MHSPIDNNDSTAATSRSMTNNDIVTPSKSSFSIKQIMGVLVLLIMVLFFDEQHTVISTPTNVLKRLVHSSPKACNSISQYSTIDEPHKRMKYAYVFSTVGHRDRQYLTSKAAYHVRKVGVHDD